MKAIMLFPLGKTNTISQTFGTNAVITGFNLRPYAHTKDANGIVQDSECGDYVYFEELLYDGAYDVSCGMKIHEDAELLSETLKDECGNLIKIDACRNYVHIKKPGIYRAIYVGEGRPEAAVTYVGV